MATVAGTYLHVSDIVVIIVYFLLVLFVGLWSSRKNRGSAGGYFLAGRNMNWIPVGASLFASNIGSLHFVGMVGSGAAAGIAIYLYELNAMYVLMILAYIFLPVYIASGVFTMPEYLKLRFGGNRIQIYLAVLALLVYIFTKISADLYAGAIFIEQSLNWNIYLSILVLLAVAAVFTIAGGLTAVIWTDFIQTIIMLIGALVLAVMAFIEVGGFAGIKAKYPDAVSNHTRHSEANSTCGRPRGDYMHLFRDPVTGDIPWPGLIGITINSIWYWCSDQVIVQRALAGKTYDHAKAGTILCAYIKILPLFMLVLPGMIARILFPETVGCTDPEICKEVCGSPGGCSNVAYPTLVVNLLPPGARGMMLAVMMSALMSSLTSIFNSSSTIFAMDIWTHIRKKASELELMIVGRMFVIVLVVISIIWIPVLRLTGTELYVYIQEVSSFLQPPICCIFLLAIFWPRLNEQGAFWGLVFGMLVGLARFVGEYSFKAPVCGEEDTRPGIIKNFHYLYFSIFLFVVTGMVATIVTMATKPIDRRCLYRLTFWTRHSKKPRLDIDSMHAEYSSSSSETSSESHEREMQVLKQTDESEDFPEKPENTEAGDVIVEDSENNANHGGTSCYRRIFNWICGLENVDKTHINKRKVQRVDMVDIAEQPRWKLVSNVAAVVCMICMITVAIVFA
ncbi:sodium/glucose cotransporter 4-like isoform X2 [Dreissena polymorpha]|uniref:sodium/glucose cotransporter 4-like isoform X2 n=1 Tax=Dreissena polymorpha TaxID=45954 RepID=UPI0022656C94|nr:sodium/glucose cotransporter 4-like isoform X2 [Dreissena polymorpha]